jgi:hypothetical protein
MSFDVEEFALYRIANAQVRRHPFPHFFVSPVFPPDYYVELLSRLPPIEWLKPIDETGSVQALAGASRAQIQAYASRFIADLADLEEREQQDDARAGFWAGLAQWMMSDRFRALVLEKFRPDMAGRFGSGAAVSTDIDARLVRDFTTYSIGPHTDTPRKLVSLLFYLPRDESMSHLGTSIYAAHDASFRCEGNRHHGYQGFKRVATMPYLPNSLFAFFKTDYSFHGVDPITDGNVERNLLLYNIYVQAVATRRSGLRWPWQRAKTVLRYKTG